jgi:hypothetical protein
VWVPGYHIRVYIESSVFKDLVQRRAAAPSIEIRRTVACSRGRVAARVDA